MHVNGYSLFQLNRTEYKKNTKRASGGIVIYVRDSLPFDTSNILIHKENDDILWLRIEGSKLNIADDVFICLCYNLPSDSSRQNLIDEDIFDRMCSYVACLKNKFGSNSHFLICGDMNARTADRDDFVLLDNSTHIDALPDEYTCDINLPRTTQDRGFNANGTQLLDFCKRSGLRIVNGRVGEDSALGRCTYVGSRGSSLIDYVIADQALFKYFTNFCVKDPNIMSDHCELNFSMQFKCHKINEQESEKLPKSTCKGKYVWNNERVNVFIENLQSESVCEQLNLMDENLKTALSNDEVDISIMSFTSLVENIAEPFFKSSKGGNNLQNVKPNFVYNEECEYKKIAFLNLLNIYRGEKSDINRSNMVRARASYNAEVRNFKLEQDKAKTKRLVDAKYKNAKEYWKLLKDAANVNNSTSRNISSNQFAEYFKAINNPDDIFFQPDEEVIFFQERFLDSEIQVMFSELDAEISKEEILKSIKQLKNGKSAGPDLLINEFISQGQHVFLPYLHTLFNKLLQIGYFPSSWAEGYIVPLHKKGNRDDVNNYRGITLLSVLGKLFSRLLNNRLIEWAETYQVYIEAQAGFRKSMSTVDNVFVLHGLITHMLNSGKQFYCAFIDFTKAFDYVVRDILWYKLIKLGVRGQILKVIKSMYQNIKSKVKCNNELSDEFSCCLGVRQGECLSPFFICYVCK